MPIGDIGKYTDRTRHNVRLNDGRIVSRSAAENLYAQSKEGGSFASEYDRKKAYRSAAFRQAKNTKAFRTGAKEAERNNISRKEYEAISAKLAANPHDKSPNGPLAEWLVATGRRTAGTIVTVGETYHL